jgi:DNA-binding transcriptional ArsR family regulator
MWVPPAQEQPKGQRPAYNGVREQPDVILGGASRQVPRLASQDHLDAGLYFDHSGNMNIKTAVQSLAALAQDSRLEVFRLLVQAGPAGLPAGEIAERLGIPASTLSFHVKALVQADLVESRHESRFIYYSARFSAMNDLIAFLGEN